VKDLILVFYVAFTGKEEIVFAVVHER